MLERKVVEEENAQEYAKLGTEYAREKKWQSAVACYQKAIKIDPNFAEAYGNLAWVLTQIGEEKAAAAYWEQALKLEPNWAGAYEQAREIKPEFWRAYLELGRAWAQTENKQKEAVEAYEQVIKLQPPTAGDDWPKAQQEAYHQLGLILIKQGKFEAAVEYVEKALAGAANTREIIESYSLALGNNPKTNPKDYFQLGKILKSKGRYDEAIDCFIAALKIKPTFYAAYGAIQYTKPVDKTKQLEKLVTCYREILAKQPDLAIVWGNLGDALTQQGQIEEAIKCYRLGCYQQTIAMKPQLGEREWKEKKENPPDFVIIGCARCGTTSLHNYLGQHPDVLLPHKKEIKFFDEQYNLGKEWYLAHFPSITDSPGWVSGEASPSYFEYTYVAPRMLTLFPQIKLIVLLRNPVERAVSWYYHQKERGKRNQTLEESIEWEIKQLERFSEPALFNKRRRSEPNNLLGSMYIYKLDQWMRIFPREQFLILQSEQLYSNPEQVMEQVYEFLGIAKYKGREYPAYNGRKYSPISKELRNRLTEYLRPHNQKLEKYLGMEFNWEEETS
ncbi:MAG: tetratricopeptide repeat protein [Gomphosphaeria aponina SAG 52.96 = DSM 107014]|uniref:Tetratricopeptide repeat protein n=1 Tax=Gomphosphaeria aponina SAG 52.96 = DSM 107014 TaxID=1521640 RepID=A0A941GVZ1_9CHRO|nr:tetratricopeptide repeat protein [Gomphosphaeria aponina SAG 52.96 = DSM 107014]